MHEVPKHHDRPTFRTDSPLGGLPCPAPLPLLKVFLLLATCWVPLLPANELILTDRLHHLRNDEMQEWSSFPEHAEASSLELSFTLPGKPVASTLRLRQQDVKQTWKVFVNGTMISKLQQDENDMVRYLAVPASVLQAKTPGILLQDEFQQALAEAADPVRQGIQVYLNQWRQSQQVRNRR